MPTRKCTHAATSNSNLARLKISKKSRHAVAAARVENTTSLTVLAVCNGTFNAAAFDGNPFLLFWGGGESSGWPTKRGEGKRPILRMASQSSLFCSDSSTARRRRGARCRHYILCTAVGLPSLKLQLTIVAA
jgi:hypothetical protein